jgi:hypothetical protein
VVPPRSKSRARETSNSAFILSNDTGLPGNTEQDYVRFDHIKDGFEIEIIVMRGWRAIVDRRLTGYLLCHPALLEEYERVKLTNAHSKRQYQKAKDRFFRAVIEKIPDDYSDLT